MLAPREQMQAVLGMKLIAKKAILERRLQTLHPLSIDDAPAKSRRP